jgi:electron transport complex protein RnfC
MGIVGGNRTNGKTEKRNLRLGLPGSHRFRGGVHPPDHKSLTADSPVRRLPFPHEMIIPLSQHLGAPAVPVVHEGQEVVRGEPLAEPGGFVSVPMHAPATGVVRRIALARNARGEMAPAIYLRLFGAASQEVLYGARVDIDAMTPEELVQAVQATGVVGLGGAAFPTHVKMALPEGKSVDTVIANGCECEPYLTTDHRVMLEQAPDIMAGLRVMLRAFGAERAIIGLEDNKLDAAAVLEEAVPDELPVTVQTMPTKYPQGAEKMLAKSLLNREVPSGGLPVDVGIACFNVATLAQIGQLLPHRQGLIERVVTVTGPGVERPGNYTMALGTPLSFVLDQVGLTSGPKQIILGGPMMGPSVSDTSIPITKGVTGILVEDAPIPAKPTAKVYPCIRCGSCVDVCPIHLNPSQLGILAKFERYEQMRDQYHLMDCFECGCCTYVCPSSIPLVQRFRVAKGVLRDQEASS